MARLALLAVLLAAAAWSAAAQPATAEAAPESNVGIRVSFRPSVAIVVGIFTMIFSLTFLLLMYAKFCHPASPSSSSPLPATLATTAAAATNDAPPPQQLGVPKPVIESLPFFRFATLRGARRGMECVVCLARFDDADLLRLLPRCRHAFHLGCVDRWLETSASCPLCRAAVDADDATLGLKYAASARIVFGGEEDPAVGSSSRRDLLDIFVERVPSTRFTVDSSDTQPRQQQEEEEEAEKLDRHRHRIVVSDVVFRSRWSELNSAALIALDTEMLHHSFSFPSPDPEYKLSSAQVEDIIAVTTTTATTTEKKLLLGSNKQKHGRSSNVVAGVSASISSGMRSVSEIVSMPRLRAPAREEENHRRWLPIARRTARWFAGRARQGEEEDEEKEGGGVHVVAVQV